MALVRVIPHRACGESRQFGLCERRGLRELAGAKPLPDLLPKRRELDVDVFPEVIDDESLFVVRQDGAHYVFVSILFLP